MIVPEILKGLYLYEKDEKLCQKIPFILTTWAQAYPLVNIREQICYAHAWEISNTKKKDRIRFINNWLKSSQQRLQDTRSSSVVPRLPPVQHEVIAQEELVTADMFAELKAKLKGKRFL